MYMADASPNATYSLPAHVGLVFGLWGLVLGKGGFVMGRLGVGLGPKSFLHPNMLVLATQNTPQFEPPTRAVSRCS